MQEVLAKGSGKNNNWFFFMVILGNFILIVSFVDFFNFLPIIGSPLYKKPSFTKRAQTLILVFPFDVLNNFGVDCERSNLLQSYGIENMNNLFWWLFSNLTRCCNHMTSMREFYNMCTFYLDLSIRPQLVVQNIKESQFVLAADCKIVSTRMERKCNQRLIISFFKPEVKHSQQFTSKILVVPDPNGTIFMTACDKQRSLQANIHPSNWTIMEAFVQVLEKYIFILLLLPEICCLGHQLIQKYRCYVIVGERYCE